MKELAERLAKAMPERFTFKDHSKTWFLGLRDTQDNFRLYNDEPEQEWWATIGPLMDELEVPLHGVWSDENDLLWKREPTWLLSCFTAAVEAAEAATPKEEA